MKNKIVFSFCGEKLKMHTDPETRYYIPKTNRTVSCKKENVPFTKRIVPCKNRAMIMYARPALKRPKKSSVPRNKRATSIYGLIDNYRSMKTDRDYL